jgi:hypothetical protein
MALKSMSIEKLVALKDQIEAMLSSKVLEQRRALESELAKLGRFQGGKSGSKVARGFGARGAVIPKYRNPEDPAETWAGRRIEAAVAGGCDQVRQEARRFPYCRRRGVKSKWGQKDPQGEKVRQEIAVSSAAAKRSLAEREADLLPAPYYHMVFTLPAAVSDIALRPAVQSLGRGHTRVLRPKRFGVLDDGPWRREAAGRHSTGLSRPSTTRNISWEASSPANDGVDFFSTLRRPTVRGQASRTAIGTTAWNSHASMRTGHHFRKNLHMSGTRHKWWCSPQRALRSWELKPAPHPHGRHC